MRLATCAAVRHSTLSSTRTRPEAGAEAEPLVASYSKLLVEVNSSSRREGPGAASDATSDAALGAKPGAALDVAPGARSGAPPNGPPRDASTREAMTWSREAHASRASATWAQRRRSSPASRSSSVSHAARDIEGTPPEATAATHCAASVVFPTPAGAKRTATRHCIASVSRPNARGLSTKSGVRNGATRFALTTMAATGEVAPMEAPGPTDPSTAAAPLTLIALFMPVITPGDRKPKPGCHNTEDETVSTQDGKQGNRRGGEGDRQLCRRAPPGLSASASCRRAGTDGYAG